jgi:hypothetical protein
MNGIYISSKIRHADRWKQLRSNGVPFISSWIDDEAPILDWNDLWFRCIDEASKCKALIQYSEGNEEVLKGALVELGCALSHNIPCFYVGPLNQTVYNYHSVTVCSTLEEAIELAIKFIAPSA